MVENNIICANSLLVEIYVLGYKLQGESILCIIKCDDVCIFSILIDSYRENNFFIMDEIIERNNIEHLDLVCWTHPHDDHSKGLKELIEKYKNEETEVFIPYRPTFDVGDCSKSTQELFQYLYERAVKNEGKIQMVADCKNMLFYHNVSDIVYNSEKFKLIVKSLAPATNVVYKNINQNLENKNEESIIFYLTLGGYSFLFTGDAQNSEIDYIPKKEIPENICFIKIPHHCSKTSNKIIDFIDNKNVIGCTTSYKVGQSNLPDTDLLDIYAEKFECIGNTCEKETENEFGISHIVFDILNDERKMEFFEMADIHKKI